ncbi:RILP-like protein-like protein [Penaeus vannamei]|uniref:RILP-like protein-like protein n=1 Tax=Penaeus vannamei TaxID=6689 RepID=A0A3R7M7Y3_PENVA|nr:RILP-like protein-like protein [Penaeus vannamei]
MKGAGCLVSTPGGGAQAGVMWRASVGVIRAGPRRPALRALISFPLRMPFISPVRSHAILAVLGVLSRVRAEASSLSGRRRVEAPLPKTGSRGRRAGYGQELEEIEDRLREESHELVAMVSRLQDENRKLSTSLAKIRREQSSKLHASSHVTTLCSSPVQVLIAPSPSHTQRSTAPNTSLPPNNSTCRATSTYIDLVAERVGRAAVRPRAAPLVPRGRKSGSTPEVDLKVVTRLQEVIEAQREQMHKTEKECHLKATELDNLKSQLEKVNHVNRELRRRQRTYGSQMRSLIDERAELQAALQEETRAVNVLRQRLGLAQKENEDLASSSSDSLDLTNKLVFDRDDPNRPRFTMTELKEILYERNELN